MPAPLSSKLDNKTARIAVFGDEERLEYTKYIWSHLAGQDVSILTPTTFGDLDDIATDCALIFVLIKTISDSNIEVAQHLSENSQIVADIVALTPDNALEERLFILGHGFDGIYGLDGLQNPKFSRILNNKIRKGMSRIDRRLEEEEYRRFRAALNAGPDAFIVFDANRRIFFVSDHYQRTYPIYADRLVRGLRVEDAFEMLHRESGINEGDPRYLPMKTFWYNLQGQQDFLFDNGKAVRLRAAPLPNGEGTIVTTTDISAYVQQKLETERRSREITSALEREQEASAIQKQFISMVSHEFRTPLSIIDGNAQILNRRAVSLERAEIEKRTKTIHSAVSRLTQMMESLLSSNILKTGKLEVHRESFSLSRMIRQMCEEHADLSSGHTITWDIDRLPESVYLDRKLTTLILTNLIANAVKFTHHNPQVHVSAYIKDNHIVIEVRDNGVGIPPEEQDKIFERFYRASTASGIPGTGVGLNLTMELTKLQGGAIAVDSIVDHGTKFIVTMPVVTPPA